MSEAGQAEGARGPEARARLEADRDTTRAVVALFDQRLRQPAPEGDLWEPQGRRRMSRALLPHVQARRPLPLLLPGFAFKNPNRAKTLGPLPDLAELRALERLSGFCAAAREVYAPGVALTLFSGGWVWALPMQVSIEEVQAYWAALRAMAEGMEGLRFEALDTLWGVSPEDALTRGFAWSDPAQIQDMRRSLQRRSAGDLRRVLQRFMRILHEDLGERLAEADPPMDVEFLVMRAMLQHRGFVQALEEAFPDHVRLSVHLCSNAGPKFGVRLIDEGPAGRLPYHCAVLQEGGRERAVFRSEAPEAVVVSRGGQPWCLAPS